MATMTYDDVWQMARRLPVSEQAGLAEALLHDIRAALVGTPIAASESDLSPLVDLSEEELRALADAVVSSERQQQLGALLAENHNGGLTPAKAETLDALLDEIDQVALLKARALYTLQVRQKTTANPI